MTIHLSDGTCREVHYHDCIVCADGRIGGEPNPAQCRGPREIDGRESALQFQRIRVQVNGLSSALVIAAFGSIRTVRNSASMNGD